MNSLPAMTGTSVMCRKDVDTSDDEDLGHPSCPFTSDDIEARMCMIQCIQYTHTYRHNIHIKEYTVILHAAFVQLSILHSHVFANKSAGDKQN